MDTFQNTSLLKEMAGWLATVSLLTFILSLVIIPWIVGKLSADCFVKYYDTPKEHIGHTPSFLAFIVLRNIAGIILILAGFAMLFLPGQGILTIIIGLVLFSFPGKRKLLFKIISRPSIQRSLNWLRRKRSKPPFIWPDSYK